MMNKKIGLLLDNLSKKLQSMHQFVGFDVFPDLKISDRCLYATS